MEGISERIARAQAGEKNVREKLVEDNLGLVHMALRRFAGRDSQEDLFQIGVIGLLKAVDRFDLSYPVKFSTYAVPMIIGEIKRFLRDDGLIKVSRTLKEDARKLKTAEKKLTLLLGREPTLSELVKETGILKENAVLALDASVSVESFETPIRNGDSDRELLLGDTISCGEREREEVLNRIFLEELMKDLGKEERELIRLRYYQSRTQTEVAKQLGVSQVQVSRMEKKLLLRLRNRCGG